MFLFTKIISLASVALILSSSIQAAPPSFNSIRSAPQLSCADNSEDDKGQLYAGDYNYGSASTKIGYKSVTDANGKEELQVVKYDENDSTIRLLDSVIKRQCNSTALNLYTDSDESVTNYSVKILADVGRHGIPYCVGLSNPSGNPSNIALVPCSFIDDDSQANQFWISQWKYANLFPVIGKSNKAGELDNYQPIKPPSDNANPAVYTTEPQCKKCDIESTYQSFYVSS